MGLNICFEFRNQVFELFQIVCFEGLFDNWSLNWILHAPFAKLIQKVTSRNSQIIDVKVGRSPSNMMVQVSRLDIRTRLQAGSSRNFQDIWQHRPEDGLNTVNSSHWSLDTIQPN